MNDYNIEETDEDAEGHRVGGNYIPDIDRHCPPYSHFKLMITGHLQSGTFNDKDGVSANLNFTQGTEWQVHSVSSSFIC